MMHNFRENVIHVASKSSKTLQILVQCSHSLTLETLFQTLFVSLPNTEERLAILQTITRGGKPKLHSDVSLNEIADASQGYTLVLSFDIPWGSNVQKFVCTSRRTKIFEHFWPLEVLFHLCTIWILTFLYPGCWWNGYRMYPLLLLNWSTHARIKFYQPF